MDLFWKQFAVSGTASSHNVFLKARLKLTALSVLIVATIVFGFSLFLYQNIKHNLKDAADDDFADPESHSHFIEKTLPSVENDLLLADISILIISAGVSFTLAGRTLKPIQRSVEAQKAFAANASHELRTPLAVIKNDIEVHLRNTSPSRELAEKTMQSNLEEINRMSGIVEDLLLLARSDNQMTVEFTSVDVSTTVESIIERMTSLAKNKNITLSHTITSSLTIEGSQSSLERVLLNILQNSIDHTPPGGSIDVLLEKEQSKLVLRITDTGSGIPAEDLPHIFKRFYKGTSSSGTGLGLSIVKEIIDQHSGEISIKSVQDKGTVVSIQLPRA